ncbi:hypothetical protein ACIA8O_35805 [Kitasatospora sp. NPDC051853]|uniref:hypothetical protein n=1 Tax=Kitasatospora sp. NPDC051853 TaxID=3364058 RepID=UPI00379C7836
MGVLYGYYAADDDAHAIGAIDRDDDQLLGTGYDGFDVKGIDPVVCLLPVEVHLSGRSAEALRQDPRHSRLVGTADDGWVLTVSLTDPFRDALATAAPDLLEETARVWSTADVFPFPSDQEGLLDFLTDLAALARRAVTRGQGLYCWACP